MMEKILITGGCGFIGSHTCINLLEAGYKVVILDSNVNSSPRMLDKIKLIVSKKHKFFKDNITFYKGDLNDYIFLNEIFNLENNSLFPITKVIHLAGLKSVSESIKDPLSYWSKNILSTINLLKVMEKFNCRNIVFSSSASVYDNSKSLHNENSSINPLNPYGNTKYAIEKLLLDVYKNKPNDWRIISLRYFNPIGAHYSGLIGELPVGIPNNIFPLLNRVASREIDQIFIYGKNYETLDGTGIRDYIHVMDVAVAHLKAMEFLQRNDPQYLIMNIGTGKGTSVLDLIKTFEKINNVEIPFSFADPRNGDVAINIADNSLMKSLLKWEPENNIEDMCKDGWRWEVNRNKDI